MFHADRVIISYPAVKVNLVSRIWKVQCDWLARLGKGMLSSVEQAFVGRDERRAPLKTPVETGGTVPPDFGKHYLIPQDQSNPLMFSRKKLKYFFSKKLF